MPEQDQQSKGVGLVTFRPQGTHLVVSMFDNWSGTTWTPAQALEAAVWLRTWANDEAWARREAVKEVPGE